MSSQSDNSRVTTEFKAEIFQFLTYFIQQNTKIRKKELKNSLPSLSTAEQRHIRSCPECSRGSCFRERAYVNAYNQRQHELPTDTSRFGKLP